MATVKLRLVDKESWSKYYDAESNAIFCPMVDPPDVGKKIDLEVMFQMGPRVQLRGQVIWRRAFGDARTRAGAGLTVHGDDRKKLSYINGYARGGLLDKRMRRRLPVQLRATYTTQAARRVNFIQDIHEHGVFLRSNELLDPGQETRLLILPPGPKWKPVEVQGVVTRLVKEEPGRGMGIKLDFKDANARQAFADFVALLEEEYLTTATSAEEAAT